MDKKNVLVISNMYPTARHQSYGIFVQSQVNALRDRGLSVDTIAIKDPRTTKTIVLRKYFIWFAQAVANLLRKGKHYDVVHAHYVFPSGLLAFFYKKMWGARLVVTAHGGDLDKMAAKHPIIFSMTKKVLQEADKVIAVGEELSSRMVKEFNVSKEKISLLNMGVDRSKFCPLDQSVARRKLKIEKDVKVLLFTGNIIYQKGILDLVAALALIRDKKIELYLIGPQKDVQFLQQLQNTIQSMGLQNQVFLLGAKPQSEIRLWMCAADVFVLPSHLEGFGLVALEAMACGLPVVGTNVGGLRYLLGDEAGLIVGKEDPESLAAGIAAMLGNHDLKKKYIQNGLKKARENDQQLIIDRLIKLYD